MVLLDAPAVDDGRLVIREHPTVVGGPAGSRARFAGEDVAVDGSDATIADAYLQRGARVVEGRARLRGRWDGLFLRVTERARARRLELRLAGAGRGTLYVGERTFWSAKTRWSTYPVSGAFRIRQPYFFPESGGGDLTITIGKSPGEVDLESVSLVPPGEPERILRR